MKRLRKLVLILLIALPCLGIGMPLLSNWVLCSEITGQVLMRGKPVAGASVRREYDWAWGNRKATDEAKTDADGHFSLPEITGRSISGALLPHQPHIHQVITVVVGVQDYPAWVFDKLDYDRNSETAGKPAALKCELTTEPHWNGKIYGICTIDGVEAAEKRPGLRF